MAHLERIAHGWRVVWREGGRGSPRHKSPVYHPKARATAELEAIQARLAAQRAPRGAVLGWSELVARYLTHRRGTTQAHRTKTERTLQALAKARGWRTAGDITPTNAEGLGRYQARLLRALLNYASDHLDQRVDRRVIVQIRPKAPRRTPLRLLTDDQVAALIAEADRWHPANGFLVHAIALYGHRAETLVALRWSDLDLDAGTIRLRVKSGDTIEHQLHPGTISRLQSLHSHAGQPAPSTHVCCGHLARPWKDGSEVAAWMGHSLKAADGTRTGVLDLRRYAITRMLDATKGDARTVSAITGHRTPSLLLNVYSRTSEARKAALVGALSLPGDTTVTPQYR